MNSDGESLVGRWGEKARGEMLGLGTSTPGFLLSSVKMRRWEYYVVEIWASYVLHFSSRIPAMTYRSIYADFSV